MIARRPLRPEDIAVLQRISSDLDRDRILAEALSQRQLASEIDAVMATIRRIIAGESEQSSEVVRFVPQSGESRTPDLASVPASLLYLAADIESLNPPAADLCRAAAELLELGQDRAKANLPESRRVKPASRPGAGNGARLGRTHRFP